MRKLWLVPLIICCTALNGCASPTASDQQKPDYRQAPKEPLNSNEKKA